MDEIRSDAVTTVVKDVTEIKGLPEGVLADFSQLDAYVTKAIQSKKPELLVTSDILKGLLHEGYKDDAYIMYRNLKLSDYEKIEASDMEDAKNVDEKNFGHSNAKITDGAILAPNKV